MKYTSLTNKDLNDKIQRLKREIVQNGNLIEFETAIGDIIQNIIESNCDISCDYTCENSRISQSIDNSFKSHIWLGFKNIKEKPNQIIWDILHEYGHHLSGKADGKEKTRERERVAWDLGLKQLSCFPELTGYVDNYKSYRDKCLKTYILHGKTESKT
jgi:hypothetical protein